ncbi:MAG TPA: hypothetical protein VND89_06415 [Acidimicrobiales bacterium]|nr:hypothetical protein [Acidimicrobiales bacterium]
MMNRLKRTVIAIAIGSMTVLPAVMLSAGAASASGVNQYNTGTAASSGLCHGAFANTNGNLGVLGSLGGSTSGGVPAGPGATGWNNSAVSGDCILG